MARRTAQAILAILAIVAGAVAILLMAACISIVGSRPLPWRAPAKWTE